MASSANDCLHQAPQASKTMEKKCPCVRKQLVTATAAAAVGVAVGALIWHAKNCKPRAAADAASGNSGGSAAASTSDADGLFGPFDLARIVRPNIASLVPYRCARDDYDSGVLLDANENSLGPPFPATGAPALERCVLAHTHTHNQRVCSLSTARAAHSS